MKKIIATILVFACIIVAGIFFIRFNKQETDVTKTKTKVGFLLNGKVDDHSWGESHYNGMKISAEELNLDVVYKEAVPEDERCVATIEELIEYGCKIIICDFRFCFDVNNIFFLNNIHLWICCCVCCSLSCLNFFNFYHHIFDIHTSEKDFRFFNNFTANFK